MKPSGFASWHAVPLHAFVRLTRRRRARHKALHILRQRRKMLHKKRLTMKHCFAKAPQYEAASFHSAMKHFAYAPYDLSSIALRATDDVRKWKMRVYPFAIQHYPHYIIGTRKI